MKEYEVNVGEPVTLVYDYKIGNGNYIPKNTTGVVRRKANNGSSAAVEFLRPIGGTEITCHDSVEPGYGWYVPWQILEKASQAKCTFVRCTENFCIDDDRKRVMSGWTGRGLIAKDGYILVKWDNATGPDAYKTRWVPASILERSNAPFKRLSKIRFPENAIDLERESKSRTLIRKEEIGRLKELLATTPLVYSDWYEPNWIKCDTLSECNHPSITGSRRRLLLLIR